MAKYDGVVTLDDADIQVDIELDNGHVRLSSSGRQIGQWTSSECLIEPRDRVSFHISAEDETLLFVPNRPDEFSAALNGKHQAEQETPTPPSATGQQVIEAAPPPKPLTVALFYSLCALTAGLAAWALASIIF